MKTTEDVIEMVRVIAAETGEKYYGVLRRVLRQELVRIKITPKAMQVAQLIAAQTGEKQPAILERLLQAELKKLGRQGQPEGEE